MLCQIIGVIAYFPLQAFKTTSVAESKPTASMNFIWQRDGYVSWVYSKTGSSKARLSYPAMAFGKPIW